LTSSSAVFSALAPYGWDETWAKEFARYDAEGLLAGRVVRVDRGQCDVVTAGGPLRADTAFVTPHDPMRVVCTGDWVAVEPGGNPRYVRAYLPRRTAFVRSTSSKRSEGQILAANVDHAIVAVSLAVELDLGRVERFLALAWERGATTQRSATRSVVTCCMPTPSTRGAGRRPCRRSSTACSS
jgi:ribosome biogenesis GTPase / thiamine phosphate phosphatase